MRELNYDAAILGGGAAGMAAALKLRDRGFSVALIDREDELGGILLQCIHGGFGLHEFGEELTGPEYAERFIRRVEASGISVFLRTTVTELLVEEGNKELVCYSDMNGAMRLQAKAVVLAMGCRERNRGNIRIPGTRPAGIYTAGLAQRLVNIEGYLPGREVVIVGSGDIGLIMARRMAWSGCKVHGVIEILPYPSGLTRNIVQCLNDFSIPLYLHHVVSRIYGERRVEGIDVMPITEGAPDPEARFSLPCDTVLLSVGLVPENELTKTAGIEMNPLTGGPMVNCMLMTSAPGVFAAGNVLQVHDLVDNVTEEAARAGRFAASYLSGERPGRQYRVKPGANVRFVNPVMIDGGKGGRLVLRSMIVRNNAEITVTLNKKTVKRIRKNHIQPSEMIILDLKEMDLNATGPESASDPAEARAFPMGGDGVLEIAII